MTNKKYKVGDIVEHKCMKGKFVICNDYAGYSFTGVKLRDKNGKIIGDVRKEELK